MKHPAVAILASVGAPWVLPIGIGLFFYKHFLSDNNNPADWRAKAAARCKPPKIKRRACISDTALKVNVTSEEEEACEDHEQQLADAVLGRAGAYEWFAEDEVEALQQAQGNPAALLNLLQEYSSRVLLAQDDASDNSLWYTDDPDEAWQHDSTSADERAQWQQQQQQQVVGPDSVDDSSQGPAGHITAGPMPEQHTVQQQQQEQQAGQEFLLQLAAAMQQQHQEQQQPGNAAVESAATNSDAAYFDDSYFGLPADASAAATDLLELQLAVNKNLEALLPKDSTWAGSYPPRFDELPSPGAGFEVLQPDFDLDDPEFDYVPEFDFDPDFDDDMFDLDLDFEPQGFEG